MKDISIQPRVYHPCYIWTCLTAFTRIYA